jgi:outer membrane protein assembly factor BamB
LLEGIGPSIAVRGGTGTLLPMAGASAGLPLHWSETEHVKWKTAIPYRGWSTPVVLGSQVWLTTATLDGHDFFALAIDTGTGHTLFQKKLFHSDHPEPLGNPVNCYASPSPVSEPGRVYVNFGSYGTACLDSADGTVRWRRRDIPCRHYRGPGSSPVLFQDLLILTMDGIDLQYLIALDKRTGRTIWKTERTADWNDLRPDGKPQDGGDLRKAFSTPLIINANGKTQMLSVGAKAAYGYDPLTGRELWKVRHDGQGAAPRPVFGQELAFLVTGLGNTELRAVRVDGEGDVTDTHVVWKASRGVPRTPSPLLVDDLLYMVADNGILTCLEAARGHEVWRQRLGGDYAASLLYADGRIYCFNQAGLATVLKAGRKTEVLARNRLADGFMASPAVSGNALFLRTRTHLYRIE